MKLQFSLNTRATLTLLTGMLGMVWQFGIATAGGSISRDLIAASVALILASLGLGVKKDSSIDIDEKSDEKE
jgi:hypothetical protein